MLCNIDKDQRLRFNLTDPESSSQQNHLSLQTTFSLRRGGEKMTGSEIQTRKGQFNHKYVRQRQKAENQPKQNNKNKSTHCQTPMS